MKSNINSHLDAVDHRSDRITPPATPLPGVRPLSDKPITPITLLLALPILANPLAAQHERTFRPLRSLGAGSELTASISLADVNGDGALDIIVANGRHWPGQNRIYLNDGRAAFTLARRLGDEQAGTYAAPLTDGMPAPAPVPPSIPCTTSDRFPPRADPTPCGACG